MQARWTDGMDLEGECWRGRRRMPEKRGRELEVKHMHNAITYHALMITFYFLNRGEGGVGGQCMKGWPERLTRGSALRDGGTPLFIVILLPQLKIISQYWRLLDKTVWWSSRRVTVQKGHFCVTLSLDEGMPYIVHWPCCPWHRLHSCEHSVSF